MNSLAFHPSHTPAIALTTQETTVAKRARLA
jgi:hypothetical protein